MPDLNRQESEPTGIEVEAAARAMWEPGGDWEQAGRCYAWDPEMEDCKDAMKQVEIGLRAALAAREEPNLCRHDGPDGAVCELPSGHNRLHLQRLDRGYVEWER